MATFKGTRFSIHFKGFSTRFPMCVWHICAGLFAFLVRKSRYLLPWGKSNCKPESPQTVGVSDRWWEFERLLQEGHPLTIEMLEEMEILEAFALLEWLKKRREVTSNPHAIYLYR